eukprot:8292930-Karenia_brevis.AAC.1
MSRAGSEKSVPDSPLAGIIGVVGEEDVQREESRQLYESLDLSVEAQYPINMVAEPEVDPGKRSP